MDGITRLMVSLSVEKSASGESLTFDRINSYFLERHFSCVSLPCTRISHQLFSLKCLEFVRLTPHASVCCMSYTACNMFSTSGDTCG